MTAVTLSAKVDESLRDRLDAMIGDNPGGRSAIVVQAIEQFVNPKNAEKQAPKSFQPHPKQEELDSIQPQIDKLNSEIAELEKAIQAINFKLSLPPEIVEVTASGVFAELEQHVKSQDANADRQQINQQLEREAIAANEKIGHLRVTIGKLQRQQQQLEREIAVETAIEEIDLKVEQYLQAVDHLNFVGLQLHQLGQRHNNMITARNQEISQYGGTYGISTKQVAVEAGLSRDGHPSHIFIRLHSWG